MTIINKIYGIDVDGRRAVSGPKRGEGFDVEKVHRKDLNQLLFELGADHIIGSQSQVTGLTATIYYDSSTTSFKDKNGAAPTILDGDKIAWRGLDTITASIDLSAYDDIEHVMFQGVTVALGAFDLDLGENQRGELDLSGTGTLTVTSSDGLRVKTSGGLVVDIQSGDNSLNSQLRNANNTLPDINIHIIKGLVVEYASASTITVDISSFKYKGIEDDTISQITWDSAGGDGSNIGLNAWDDGGSAQKVNSKSEHYLWLLIKTSDGTLKTVAGYNKTAPAITGSAFDGYEVITLLSHFVTDGSGNVVDFIKRGNSFIFKTHKLVVTTTATSYQSGDISAYIPEIDEIEDNKLKIGGDQVGTGGGEVASIYSLDGTNEYYRVIVELDAGREIWTFPELPYQTTHYIKSDSGGNLDCEVWCVGCRYNNIIGG